MYDVLVRPQNLSRVTSGLGLLVCVKPAAASLLTVLGVTGLRSQQTGGPAFGATRRRHLGAGAGQASQAMVEPGIVSLDRRVGLTSFGDAFEVPRRHAHLHARFDGGLLFDDKTFATFTAEVTAPP